MLIAAIIIYIIFAFIRGPLWPLELLGGKAGGLGYLMLVVWLFLLIKGMN
jgi:hypothetical protein